MHERQPAARRYERWQSFLSISNAPRTKSPVAISKVDHTGLTVSSLEDALASWVDVLRFHQLYTWKFENTPFSENLLGVEGAEMSLALPRSSCHRGRRWCSGRRHEIGAWPGQLVIASVEPAARRRHPRPRCDRVGRAPGSARSFVRSRHVPAPSHRSGSCTIRRTCCLPGGGQWASSRAARPGALTPEIEPVGSS